MNIYYNRIVIIIQFNKECIWKNNDLHPTQNNFENQIYYLIKGDYIMNNNYVILNGKVTFAKFGSTNKDNRNMYRLTIECNNLDDTYNDTNVSNRGIISSAYVGSLMCPKFVKDETCNTVNLKSLYDIALKCEDDNINTFQKWLDDGRTIDAEVSVKCIVVTKNDGGAIYPTAIIVRKFGSKYDFFADFN